MFIGIEFKTFVKRCNGKNINEVITVGCFGLCYVKGDGEYLVPDVDYSENGDGDIKCLKNLVDCKLEIVYCKRR